MSGRGWSRTLPCASRGSSLSSRCLEKSKPENVAGQHHHLHSDCVLRKTFEEEPTRPDTTSGETLLEPACHVELWVSSLKNHYLNPGRPRGSNGAHSRLGTKLNLQLLLRKQSSVEHGHTRCFLPWLTASGGTVGQ